MMTRTIKTALLALLTIAALAAAPPALATDDDDEDEQELTLDQLPAQVRATVEAEARGAEILEIDLEHDKTGKVIFEVEIRKGGEKVEVQIGADGKVIKRKGGKRAAK